MLGAPEYSLGGHCILPVCFLVLRLLLLLHALKMFRLQPRLPLVRQQQQQRPPQPEIRRDEGRGPLLPSCSADAALSAWKKHLRPRAHDGQTAGETDKENECPNLHHNHGGGTWGQLEPCVLCGCILGPDMYKRFKPLDKLSSLIRRGCVRTPYVYEHIVNMAASKAGCQERAMPLCVACINWVHRLEVAAKGSQAAVFVGVCSCDVADKNQQQGRGGGEQGTSSGAAAEGDEQWDQDSLWEVSACVFTYVLWFLLIQLFIWVFVRSCLGEANWQWRKSSRSSSWGWRRPRYQ